MPDSKKNVNNSIGPDFDPLEPYVNEKTDGDGGKAAEGETNPPPNADGTAVPKTLNKSDGGPDKDTKDKKRPPPKLSFSKIVTTIARVMNKEYDKIPAGFPKFHKDFRVCKAIDSDGVIVIEVNNNTATTVDDDDVIAAAITDYCNDKLERGKFKCYGAAASFGLRIVTHFKKMDRKNLEPYPKSFGFLEDPELCFNRAWYEPEECAEDDPDVKFIRDSIYERADQPDPFMMEYGANLEPKSSRKQCPVLLGPTNSGKSTFDIINSELLGEAHKAMTVENASSSFGMFRYIGARSVSFDEPPMTFIQSEAFLRITGRTSHPMNRKFKDERSINVDARTWLFTNTKPNLSKPEVKARIHTYLITNKMDRPLMSEDKLRKLIRKGIPKFAFLALKKYREACPNNEPIPYNYALGDKAIAAYKNPIDRDKKIAFDYIIEAHIEVQPNGYISAGDLTNFVEDYRGKSIKTGGDAAELRAYIISELNLTEARICERGVQIRVWIGATLRGTWRNLPEKYQKLQTPCLT